MAIDPANAQIMENVLRAISTAARSLRLYPPTSPIPLQGIETAMGALREFFASGAPILELDVAREGFAYDGEPVATNLVVSLELASALRDHGASQVSFLPDTSPEDLLGFLSAVSRSPEDVRAEGGLAAVIQARGVGSMRVTDVQLIHQDQATGDSSDSQAPLREIVRDVKRLTRWFAGISSGDQEAFRAGLSEFVKATGAEGENLLADALAESLVSQPAENRDALFALALEQEGPAREVTAIMFEKMNASDIATAILSGKFGRNMLSLSSVLTSLPLDHTAESVRGEVLDMLPTAGHSPQETEFLGHMLDVRSGLPELPLAETDGAFQAVVNAGAVSEDYIVHAREATTAAATVMNAVGVRTMLTLLDLQTDCGGFCETADSLAGMIPHLCECGELSVVESVLDELSARRSAHPEWPELAAHFEALLVSALDPQSASTMMHAAVEDRTLIPLVKSILRYSNEPANSAIATEAIALKSDGLEVAEELVGRRLLDLLFAQAPRAQWFQLGPLVERFAIDGSPRAMATSESLLARPEGRARQEVVAALASVNNAAVLPLLGQALRDTDEKVAAMAAHAIARNRTGGSTALLAKALSELDIDGSGFTRARELIGALAQTKEPAAEEALQNLASRHKLIARGHFTEIQQLVSQALEIRRRGGGQS